MTGAGTTSSTRTRFEDFMGLLDWWKYQNNPDNPGYWDQVMTLRCNGKKCKVFVTFYQRIAAKYVEKHKHEAFVTDTGESPEGKSFNGMCTTWPDLRGEIRCWNQGGTIAHETNHWLSKVTPKTWKTPEDLKVEADPSCWRDYE